MQSLRSCPFVKRHGKSLQKISLFFGFVLVLSLSACFQSSTPETATHTLPEENTLIDSSFNIIQHQTLNAQGLQTTAVNSTGEIIIGEVGKLNVRQAKDSDWHTFTLTNIYDSPIVVMNPVAFNGTGAAMMRVRNVDSDSFEFKVDNWKYGSNKNKEVTVSFLVMEQGRHTIGQMSIEADFVEVTANFVDENFQNSFSNTPVILAQPQSVNSQNAFTTNIQNVSASGFEVRLLTDNASSIVTSETVGYVALSQHAGTLLPVTDVEGEPQLEEYPFEVVLTEEEINQKWSSLSFQNTYTNPIFLASQQTTNSDKTTSLRYQDLTSNSVEIKIQDENSKGGKGNHPFEAIGYVVFEGETKFLVEEEVLTDTVGPTGGSLAVAGGSYVSFSQEFFSEEAMVELVTINERPTFYPETSNELSNFENYHLLKPVARQLILNLPIQQINFDSGAELVFFTNPNPALIDDASDLVAEIRFIDEGGNQTLAFTDYSLTDGTYFSLYAPALYEFVRYSPELENLKIGVQLMDAQDYFRVYQQQTALSTQGTEGRTTGLYRVTESFDPDIFDNYCLQDNIDITVAPPGLTLAQENDLPQNTIPEIINHGFRGMIDTALRRQYTFPGCEMRAYIRAQWELGDAITLYINNYDSHKRVLENTNFLASEIDRVFPTGQDLVMTGFSTGGYQNVIFDVAYGNQVNIIRSNVISAQLQGLGNRGCINVGQIPQGSASQIPNGPTSWCTDSGFYGPTGFAASLPFGPVRELNDNYGDFFHDSTLGFEVRRDCSLFGCGYNPEGSEIVGVINPISTWLREKILDNPDFDYSKYKMHLADGRGINAQGAIEDARFGRMQAAGPHGLPNDNTVPFISTCFTDNLQAKDLVEACEDSPFEFEDYDRAVHDTLDDDPTEKDTILDKYSDEIAEQSREAIDSYLDNDKDGFNNGEEQEAGSDPEDPDSTPDCPSGDCGGSGSGTTPPDDPDDGSDSGSDGSDGNTFGDPNMTSFDDLFIRIHSVGEFILARSIEDDFEVQVRFVEVENGLSANSAVAINVAGDKVGIYTNQGESPSIFVNGEELDYGDRLVLAINLENGGILSVDGTEAMVVWPDGTVLTSELMVRQSRSEAELVGSVKISAPSHRANKLEGILGDFNGDWRNDIQTRDGTVLESATLEEIHTVFAESWRITQSESLFDYEPGLSTIDYIDRSAPREYVTLDTLDPVARENAEQICRDAGIIDARVLTGCIIDVAATGDPAWAAIAVGLDPNILDIRIIPLTFVMLVNETRDIGAVVSGRATNSQAVTWTSDLGQITGSGNTISYTAPNEPGEYSLSVSLDEDPSVANTAKVIVLESLLTGDDTRFRLSWDAEPRDLDSHLWLPEEYACHILYYNVGSADSAPFATLDRDDTNGFGIETITVHQRFNLGQYEYAVYNYSGEVDFNTEGIQVEIYTAQGRITTFTPPENSGSGDWWHVFSVDGTSGQIIEVNEVLDVYEPYVDFDSSSECGTDSTVNLESPLQVQNFKEKPRK